MQCIAWTLKLPHQSGVAQQSSVALQEYAGKLQQVEDLKEEEVRVEEQAAIIE